MKVLERTRESELGPRRVPSDALGSFSEAGAAAARAFLVVAAVIGMIAVLLAATVDRSIIRSISDRLANVPAAPFAP